MCFTVYFNETERPKDSQAPHSLKILIFIDVFKHSGTQSFKRTVFYRLSNKTDSARTGRPIWVGGGPDF